MLHPHVGTLVERGDEVQRIVEESEVALCLDTGHLTLGGIDPAELAASRTRRIVHVHLKDVHSSVAERLRTGELTLVEAAGRALLPARRRRRARRGTVRASRKRATRAGTCSSRTLALAADIRGTGPVADAARSIGFLNRDGIRAAAAAEGGDSIG